MPTRFTAVGRCTPSPQSKPNKTCTKTCVVPPMPGWDAWDKASDLWWPRLDWCFTQQKVNLPLNLHTFLLLWSPQIFKQSSKYSCACTHGSPMQFQFLAAPQELWMTAREAASDCAVITFHHLLPWICGAGSSCSCPGSRGAVLLWKAFGD